MVYLCKWDNFTRTLTYFKQVDPNVVTWTVHLSHADIFVDAQHALDAAIINDIHDYFLLQEVDHD